MAKSTQFSQFVLAAVFIAAGIVFPLYEVRPNRIAGGVDQSFFDLSLVVILIFISFLFVLAILNVFVKGIRPFILTFLSMGILVWLALVLGPVAAPQVLGERLGRISPGLGSLFLLLAAFVPFLDRSKTQSGKVWLVRNQGLLLNFPAALIIILFVLGQYDHLGFIKEWSVNQELFFGKILGHLRITFFALALAMALGPLLAYWAYQNRTFDSIIQPALNVTQTIPSLVFFGFFMTLILGLLAVIPWLKEIGVAPLGDLPVILALAIYALFPITKNTLVAFRSVSPGIIDAARGMGFTSRQIWTKIRLPLSLPILLGGVRIAIVQTMGSAVLAKLISGDGLGFYIIEGLNSKVDDMVILGVLTLLVLTYWVDNGFSTLQQWLDPTNTHSRKPNPLSKSEYSSQGGKT